MSNLRLDVADLHKWGNPPTEIAKILGVHVDQVTSMLIALGLMKRPEKARRSAPQVPRDRANQLRKLDAEIKFYETRVASLKQHRVALLRLEQTGARLVQKINEARR